MVIENRNGGNSNPRPQETITVEHLCGSHSCSWCHTLNDVREEFCSNCGHCAHVPRAQCYCPECKRRMGVGR